MRQSDNDVKEKMAEALISELLRSSGNKVCPFGSATVLQNLTEIAGQSKIGQQISSIPDFLVLNQSGKPFFVEVRFHSYEDTAYDRQSGLINPFSKFWKAKLILVTLQKPHSLVANPPYLDANGTLHLENLEEDRDLNVSSEELRKFAPLVERYLAEGSTIAAMGH
jgi:hypothetical protein